MFLVELARGLWTTLKSMAEKPVTIQYPEVKRPVKQQLQRPPRAAPL